MVADKGMSGAIYPVMHCLQQAIKGFKAFIAGLFDVWIDKLSLK
jgi:hypothetical protein